MPDVSDGCASREWTIALFVQKQRQKIVRCSLGHVLVGTTGLVTSSCGNISPVFLTYPSFVTNPENLIWPIVNNHLDAYLIVLRVKSLFLNNNLNTPVENENVLEKNPDLTYKIRN